MKIYVEAEEKKHEVTLTSRAQDILKMDIIPRIKAGTKELIGAKDETVLVRLIEELLKAHIRQAMEL